MACISSAQEAIGFARSRERTKMNARPALLSVPAAVASIVIYQTTAALAGDTFSSAEQSALTAIVEKGMNEQRQPGLNVGIWIPGRGSWTTSLGTADIGANRPMDRADAVRIASITKTFVATAILQLIDRGKLALDDKLATYVEGIPNGEGISVHQLLGMTSGIREFMDTQLRKDFAANPLMPFSPQDVVAVVKRSEREFAPGEKVSYCDSNYTLLGIILEKVTGKPVAQVINEQVLIPLKLHRTSFPTTTAMPAPFARGYYAGDDGKEELKDYTFSNPNVPWTAGAMISTLDDLRVWAKALATGVLLKPETQAVRLRFGALADGSGLSGYGLGVAKFGDFIGHSGVTVGYTTGILYLPDADATLVVEGNQSSMFSNGATEVLLALAKHLFPERFANRK
jgi:D-alanyl-D-alanine carboxypeptidase